MIQICTFIIEAQEPASAFCQYSETEYKILNITQMQQVGHNTLQTHSVLNFTRHLFNALESLLSKINKS